MKITAIKQQQKIANRYSVFVEGKYAFSLGESALLESKLSSGTDLSLEQVNQFKKLSADDKIYSQVLRWVAARPRTRWEISTYLERKQASPALTELSLNKLSDSGLVDDVKYASSFINDRQLLRPASRRKLVLELRKKRIPDEIIQQAMKDHETHDEQAALTYILERKRKQSKYQDDTRLMQYLARQGFSYDDIKTAMNK